MGYIDCPPRENNKAFVDIGRMVGYVPDDCVLYIPFYREPEQVFSSSDKQRHVIAPSGAFYLPYGRYFDGVDDRVSIPNAPTLNFGTGDFSVVVWVKRLAGWGGTTYPSLMGKKLIHPEFEGQGWAISRYDDSAIQMHISLGAGGGTRAMARIGTPSGRWTLCGWSTVRDGVTTFNLPYANGDFIPSTYHSSALAVSVDNDRPLAICRCDLDYAASQLTTALILGEIWLFNKALSNEEHRRLYRGSVGKYMRVLD